ncbi:MAG TPA: undecaprenyldiphospho-muramoylpentapeptide beta-N-acetylglucosaminyltransferase, partial [Candidatus Sulfotelmatobacter sp.]|nr:undecaprenyldiphospho-muramoylpentapeptide beta-N-acetylglucosaminyltransferase [Candidatus Sulfotelmatobacter sp.]
MRVVITGGGTGGHLFPALAAQEALLRRRPEAAVLFVGAARGMEATLLPRLGHAFRGLPARQVMGAGLGGRLRSGARLPGVVWQARGILREFRPDVVLGVGGYASVPTAVAARLQGVPVVLHEQNAYPGLANRWLGRVASAVAVSFAAALPRFPAGRTTLTGNPVRAAIHPGDQRAARERLGLDPARFTVLIFGGSQGAHRLNEALRAALPRLAAGGRPLQFIHATGERDLAEVQAAYGSHGISARASSFVDDMPTAYQAADFVVCRAGAGTIFELAAVGKPALLVPYPYAANDHQRLNAEALVQLGAAWLLLDQHCDGVRLAAAVEAAYDKPAPLAAMA